MTVKDFQKETEQTKGVSYIRKWLKSERLH